MKQRTHKNSYKQLEQSKFFYFFVGGIYGFEGRGSSRLQIIKLDPSLQIIRIFCAWFSKSWTILEISQFFG